MSCIDGDAGSDLRSVVAEIYASYSRLSSSRVEEPRSGSDTEFHRLLDLTSRHQSNSSINRLAMRLLPRLVHKSPTHSEPVIRMLMQTLSSNGISGDEAIACAARNDAMQGLQTIMDVAISHLPPSDAGRLALHVSRFVISLLAPQPTLSSKRSLESTLPLPSPDPEAIVASCFTSFPRAVLSLCLSSFLDPPSSVMGQGSLIALNRVILAKPPPSLNLPSKKESNSSESLAALILDRLPETRAWLRQQIVDICKGEM